LFQGFFLDRIISWQCQSEYYWFCPFALLAGPLRNRVQTMRIIPYIFVKFSGYLFQLSWHSMSPQIDLIVNKNYLRSDPEPIVIVTDFKRSSPSGWLPQELQFHLAGLSSDVTWLRCL
jgi:hypothetical protein